MAKRAYNLTDDVSLLVHLLVKRVDQLAHIQPGRVIHGVSQARTRSRYGVYAQCHGLRFKHGQREHKTRDGHAWQWPIIKVRGQEVLYYITYFLPRFLDQPPRERLHTLLHELYHISPKFNGDLRRFAGRNEFHGNKHADFDGVVDRILERAMPHVDVERFPFLVYTFDQLVERFGGVVGNKLKRFHPKKVRLDDLPGNLAVAPPGRRRSRQIEMF
ncbi:MAG: hypothetical protein KDB90_04865 [Planctomycetes bacterium]|nr:hypothetical protein [Planctomycetota bacterium]